MFHHLHGHSYHSNIHGPDALASPEQLVERAVEAGLSSVCITDHASISGVPSFVKAAEKAGIKPIVGSELYVCADPAWRPPSKKDENTGPATEEGRGRSDYSHLVAIARNWEGFVELCRLLSVANGDPNFYRRPRNSFEDVLATEHLIFSTACAGGLLKRDDYAEVCKRFADAIGPERFYLEIQPHVDPGQRLVNLRAIELHEALGIPLVATQDFHYARADDSETHEVILAIGSKATWSDPDRWKYPVDDLFMKAESEMIEAFRPWLNTGTLKPEHVLQAIQNTERVAANTDFKWRKVDIKLPQLSDDPKTALMQMAVDTLKAKGLTGDTRYVQRLAYELRVISDAGFLDYFLVLADIIRWCKSNNIMVGPGRGSSGGSLLCYLIGITSIDPLVHGLIFERFYRPGRLDLPDIDSDFEDERRDDVIQYIADKYGEGHVCGVASYTKLKPRGVLKDLARVFQVPFQEVNQVTNAIQVADIQIDSDDAEKAHAEEVYGDPAVSAFFAKYPVIEQHARRLAGWMRGTGQHAAGVAISATPVADHAAIMRKSDRRVACWDKWVIEDMGLMKLDILGLRTMTILRHAAENVRRQNGRRVIYEDLPLDDPATLALFDSGDTTGVFQCESHGMREVFKGCKVDRFSTIADVISLYRPGPMALIPRYQSAQTGKSTPSYPHELMKPILEPTHGIMIYQEQLMQTFADVGGFDYAHADKMRKIVGKKLGPDEFRKHEQDFVSGALDKGVDEGVARDIFNSMVEFAGYGFNKSHAVAYAIIGYWTAYMKAHYPAAFWAAHLTCTENEDKLKMAMKDVLKARITVAPPSVNMSEATRFVPIAETIIQAPMTSIKGVGEKQASMIVGARQGEVDRNGLRHGETRSTAKGVVAFDGSKVEHRSFRDDKDFDARVYARVVNKGVREKMERAGAIPWFEPHADVLAAARRELLGAIMQEVPHVDEDGVCDLSETAMATLQYGVFKKLDQLGKETMMTQVYPGSGGSEPRIMLVFGSPSVQEERKQTMGHGDGFKLILEVIREAIPSLKPRHFYTSSLYRCRKPPVGWDKWAEDYAQMLDHEIKTIRPPVIVALGGDAVKHFTGEPAGKKNGSVEVVNGRPVVCGIHPSMVLMERSTREELDKVAIALSELL